MLYLSAGYLLDVQIFISLQMLNKAASGEQHKRRRKSTNAACAAKMRLSRHSTTNGITIILAFFAMFARFKKNIYPFFTLPPARLAISLLSKAERRLTLQYVFEFEYLLKDAGAAGRSPYQHRFRR